MSEAFLQYLWRHRLLSGSLATSEGQPVTVISPGTQNTDAGPDFENAQLSIGGVRWAGSVEVHVRSSDWLSHNHSADPAYSNVILHVVYEHDANIRTHSGSSLPTVELKPYIPVSLWHRYESLMNPTAGTIACADHLAQMPQFETSSWLERLVVERLQRKSSAVSQMLKENKGSWETTCYWLVAYYLGGRPNAFPFELLAKSTPLPLLARYKDDPLRIEALLMGQAGLLDGYFSDDFPRLLQSEYEILRKGHSLSPLSPHLWKFFRMRPTSFPTVRISQFASLVASSRSLFSRLLEADDVKKLSSFFAVSASDYWTDHYQFDRLSDPSAKHVGKMLIDSLIINAWVPLLFVYGKQHGRDDLCERAVGLLRQMKPESNNIVRQWVSCGLKPRDAADSQALLQLHNSYCDVHRCLDCRFGFLLMKESKHYLE